MDTSSAPFFGLDGLHVLSVDDDGDTLDIVRAILEDAGAVVTTAFSAREGLEMLQRERPAVLVSDIVMPTEDGFWLIAQVRGLSLCADPGRRVPVEEVPRHRRGPGHQGVIRGDRSRDRKKFSPLARHRM